MQRALVIVSLLVPAGVATTTGNPVPGKPAVSSEVVRLKAHFDVVDSELKSRKISSLTTKQQARRAQLVSWLRDYRNSGTFPVNDRFVEAKPFFRDSNGTLCAMAYLIHRSGRSDIVDKVEATRNNAYIAELAGDPALIAWLDSSGLSLAEAARIQPAYEGDPDRSTRMIVDYNVSPVLLATASLGTAALNALKPSYAAGALGLLAGGITIGVTGKYAYDNDRIERGAGLMMSIGGLAVGAGVHGLLAARRQHTRAHEDRNARSRDRVSMTITPDFDVRRSESRLGFRVAGRF